MQLQNIVPAIVAGGTIIGVYGLNKVSRFNIGMDTNAPVLPGICNNNNNNNNNSNKNISTNGQSLDPKAIPFTPANIQPIQTNTQVHIPSRSIMLSPIEEETHLDSFPNLPYENKNEWECVELNSSQPSHDMLKLRNIIFISTNMTRDILRKDAIIKEFFNTERDLFYHLRWQVRMQVIDKKYKIFKSNINDDELIMFHSDLHHTNNNNSLYIIGVQNDINKSHSTKWKMTQLLTASEIFSMYSINLNDLSQPLRPELHKTVQLKKDKYIKDLNNYKMHCMNAHKPFMKMEQIKKKTSGEILSITCDELNKCVVDSINNYKYINLMSIIWFDKKEHANYKTQMLLPIKLRGNNWIGIVFDYNNNGQLIPVTICVDHIDIQRKLALYKPLNNGEEYKWFTNNISEIKIINDQWSKLIRENKEQAKTIKYLKMLVAEKDKQIAKLMELHNNYSG